MENYGFEDFNLTIAVEYGVENSLKKAPFTINELESLVNNFNDLNGDLKSAKAPVVLVDGDALPMLAKTVTDLNEMFSTFRKAIEDKLTIFILSISKEIELDSVGYTFRYAIKV